MTSYESVMILAPALSAEEADKIVDKAQAAVQTGGGTVLRVDKMGRKKLLLIGSVGTALCLAAVAAIFMTGRGEKLLVWILVGYIASFAFSQGSVIWVYISEVFPNLVRAKGQSLGSFTHWFMNALISGVFPLMAAASGAVPFIFFACMMVAQFIVVAAIYPETKGITLEDMERKLS